MRVQMELPFQSPCDPDEQVEYLPSRCPHEIQVVDTGSNGNLKSECDLTVKKLGRTMWTNCRVWGRCTLRLSS